MNKQNGYWINGYKKSMNFFCNKGFLDMIYNFQYNSLINKYLFWHKTHFICLIIGRQYFQDDKHQANPQLHCSHLFFMFIGGIDYCHDNFHMFQVNFNCLLKRFNKLNIKSLDHFNAHEFKSIRIYVLHYWWAVVSLS